MFKNIANIVTLIGFLFAILAIIALFNGKIMLSLIYSFLTAISDFADGKLARGLDIKSDFGAAFDRFRDKVYTCFVLIALVCKYGLFFRFFTMALILAIVTIEGLLFIAWFAALFEKVRICSNIYGKIKVFVEFSVAIFWIICMVIEQKTGFVVMKYSIYVIELALIVALYYSFKSLRGYYDDYIENNKKNGDSKQKALPS